VASHDCLSYCRSTSTHVVDKRTDNQDTEVGVAWLGTLCQTTSNQQSGSVVSGTGVSTASRTEWSLVAHEIGHK
jgi:hypothetical protein